MDLWHPRQQSRACRQPLFTPLLFPLLCSLHFFALLTSVLSSLLCPPDFSALFTSLCYSISALFAYLLSSLFCFTPPLQFSVARMYLGCFSSKFLLIRISDKNKASSFLGHDRDHKLRKEPLNTSHCVTSTSFGLPILPESAFKNVPTQGLGTRPARVSLRSWK